MGALIPLAISLAPEIGRWLFGGAGEKTAAAVAQAVQAVTGTSDGAVAQATIDRDPAVAAQLRVRLAEIAAGAEQAARQADLDMLRAMLAADQGQNEVNKVEAASPHWFVAAWRAAVGWVGVISLALYYWPTFLIGSYLWAWASIKVGTIQPRPDLGILDLLGLLSTLLGMGGLRAYEKIKGVATNNITWGGGNSGPLAR